MGFLTDSWGQGFLRNHNVEAALVGIKARFDPSQVVLNCSDVGEGVTNTLLTEFFFASLACLSDHAEGVRTGERLPLMQSKERV